jgi:hypothetical protein
MQINGQLVISLQIKKKKETSCRATRKVENSRIFVG